jgi:alpha-1,3-mannosyl-glycoprotein beta-1,2-N-acetylglucosaminyltransferase
MCYNRPDYLRRTLDSLFSSSWSTPHPVSVFVSQDGAEPGVAAVIQEFQARARARAAPLEVGHWQHPRQPPPGGGQTGYHFLARHFGWALGRLFGELAFARVIVLEDDLDVAPDFLPYFLAAAPLLDADASLMCVSAWNDNGQEPFVADPAALYRSDFFPGLGWMLTARLWAELGPRWPDGYWDDWLREPGQRKDRACIRPEVSRTYTFGEAGTSNAQFYAAFLRPMRLNRAGDAELGWAARDMSPLLKPAYDAAFADAVRGARRVGSVSEVREAAAAMADGSSPSAALRLDYAGLDGDPSGASYTALASQLGMFADVKAGVPRTAYYGVLTLRVAGALLHLVPSQPAPVIDGAPL